MCRSLEAIKRSNGVSASYVRGEYLSVQIPRTGVDCDTFTLQTPDFSAYLPEINHSYLAPHNSPYHVESIAEHVALTVHNARKETTRPALVDIAAFHDLGKSVARTPQDYPDHHQRISHPFTGATTSTRATRT